MIVDDLLKQVEQGRESKNQGLSQGMPRLEQYTDGVSQGTYTLLGAGSGSGKTTFALYAYVYRPLVDNPEADYNVLCFSLEMSPNALFAKLLSMYIWEHYGIEISTKEMLSRTKGRILPNDLYDVVLEASEWLRSVEHKITIYDKPCSAPVVQNVLKKYLENFGTFKESSNRTTFIKKNESQIITVMLDHGGLLRPTAGNSLKQEIDNTSAVFVQYRNVCGISPLFISQLNREQGSMERRKQNLVDPRRQDFKDSANPEQDSDIIIALYDPTRDMLKSYHGYDVQQLTRVIRGILVLKSRYGDGDVFIGSAFYGKVGHFRELPKSSMIGDYTKWKTIHDCDAIIDEQNEDKIIITDNSSIPNIIL